MLELNKIYNEDCIAGMNQLFADNGECINSIITDPPYKISKKNNFHTMNRAGIDFGQWDKEFNLTSWIKPAVSLLKPGGNIVIFNDWKNMSYIKDTLEENNCLVKEMLIWHKPNPMPRNRDRLYVTSCEFAIWATKGSKWVFNRQRDNYENAVFTYPVVHNTKRVHPTQKPIELICNLIKIHTNPNDVVLDPFVGGGTTPVACLMNNRSFIGYELDPIYYTSSNTRIKEFLMPCKKS